MEEHLSYLEDLVRRGGPRPSEYNRLNSVFSSIAAQRRKRILSDPEIEQAWSRLSDAFYTTETMQGYATLKPYGYAGDFRIIDRIYQEWISPEHHLERWDLFFHTQLAPNAVRNRKRYFLAVLSALGQRNPSAHVLNVASGPGRGVADYLSNGRAQLSFDCIDHHENAIKYASALTQRFSECIRFHCTNVFRFSASRHYDLIWSAGLFDYLEDRAAKILIQRLLRFLKPGGELIFGNFSPDNPTRDYMEFGDWFLHYRSADELERIAEKCGLSAEHVEVHSEPLGVNLFLHARP